jgi:hypothetical protein
MTVLYAFITKISKYTNAAWKNNRYIHNILEK